MENKVDSPLKVDSSLLAERAVSRSQVNTHPLIADYDADNYDYRKHWQNRAYEQWAESLVIERFFASVGQVPWLVDFGGGFGRNVIHYRQRTEHAVLVDYSLGNLEHAASMYAEEIKRGRLFLIRADLYRLPFINRAFDAGLIIRVLHHLTEADDALGEMGRVIGQQWLLDVPIKHHIFARLRALMHGEVGELSTDEPKLIGAIDTPFANFQLSQIRRILSEYGWDNSILASVNNFRRWDRLHPQKLLELTRPAIYALEVMMQQMGKGWWGPNQFVRATRHEPEAAQELSAAPLALHGTPWAMLATKMHCPVCHLPLHWSYNAARCKGCSRLYPQTGPIWDFVP